MRSHQLEERGRRGGAGSSKAMFGSGSSFGSPLFRLRLWLKPFIVTFINRIFCENLVVSYKTVGTGTIKGLQ